MIRYYLDWFYEKGFSQKLAEMLKRDITERKSLVMISADPFNRDEEDHGDTERSWLERVGIVFDEHHLVRYQMTAEEAQRLVKGASVIFLLGGMTTEQNDLLVKYGLMDLIRKSSAVVMGTSAGAINMSAKWVCGKVGYRSYQADESTLYEGIGLDPFSIESHSDFENNTALQAELSPLSFEMDIYVVNNGGALRVTDDKTDILGFVLLFSQGKMQKLDETI